MNTQNEIRIELPSSSEQTKKEHLESVLDCGLTLAQLLVIEGMSYEEYVTWEDTNYRALCEVGFYQNDGLPYHLTNP